MSTRLSVKQLHLLDLFFILVILQSPCLSHSLAAPIPFPKSFGIFATKGQSEKPWERPYDPGNAIPLSQLEKEATEQELDEAIDSVSGIQANANIIRPYKPDRRWLWSRWSGTILQRALPWCVANMGLSLFLCFVIRKYTHVDWALGEKPSISHPVISRLKMFDKLWQYLLTLTTFILTFFLSEAYRYWTDFYNLARSIQGRMNDISLLMETHATRNDDEEGSSGSSFSDHSRYTPQARAFLDDMGRYLRMFHVLMWASYARRFRLLLTNRGMTRMVKQQQEGGIDCGSLFMTVEEKDTLDRLEANGCIAPNQKHNVCLEWAAIRFIRALKKEKAVVGGTGLEYNALTQFSRLRGAYASIADKVDGRMPLAYAHLVQIMVDAFLFCAPFAQVAELGAWSVLSVGLLTLIYSGLLDLAKVLMDPLNNEDGCESVHMDLSVLIRESNAGSMRWKNGVEYLPPF